MRRNNSLVEELFGLFFMAGIWSVIGLFVYSAFFEDWISDGIFLFLFFAVPILAMVFYYKLKDWRNAPSKEELEKQEKQRKLDDIEDKKRQVEFEKEEKEKEKERAKERKERDFWFKLGGRETEEEIQKVFDKLGFITELTPPSNDSGIDLILDGKIPVQIKNQKKKVGRPDLQRFRGSMKDFEKGVFISIKGFADTAKEYALSSDKQIFLSDVNDVIKWNEGIKPVWDVEERNVQEIYSYDDAEEKEVTSTYEGEYQEIYSDDGEIVFDDAKYEGEIEFDYAKYEGEIENGEPNGLGTLIYPNGKKHEGEWKNGEPYGQGTNTYPSGDKYEGGFKGYYYDGKGTKTWSDGRKYKGEWKNGQMNGKGTLTESSGTTYEGEWKNGKENGKGKYTYSWGDKYVGEFKDGEQYQGTYTWSDGTKYEGEWKDGEMWNGTKYDKDVNIQYKVVNGEEEL